MKAPEIISPYGLQLEIEKDILVIKMGGISLKLDLFSGIDILHPFQMDAEGNVTMQEKSLITFIVLKMLWDEDFKKYVSRRLAGLSIDLHFHSYEPLPGEAEISLHFNTSMEFHISYGKKVLGYASKMSVPQI